jgi:ketosteroid isomerase-like protein
MLSGDDNGEEHPNAALVRSLIEAWRAGDVGPIDAVMSPELVWHFPGRSRLAGDHRGRDEVLAFLLDVLSLSGNTFELDLIDVMANDRRAVVVFRGRARRDGRRLDNPTCLSMRLEAGRVVEVWEFVWDLHAVDRFWGADPRPEEVA